MTTLFSTTPTVPVVTKMMAAYHTHLLNRVDALSDQALTGLKQMRDNRLNTTTEMVTTAQIIERDIQQVMRANGSVRSYKDARLLYRHLRKVLDKHYDALLRIQRILEREAMLRSFFRSFTKNVIES